MRIEDIDTPALIVDLDGLEDNLDRYQQYFDEHGIGLRPHIKTHKCLAIAHMQMRRGAMGITCQKLGEAEVMAAGGIDDILITYEIVGRTKINRLMALCRHADMMVTVDDAQNVTDLSEATQAFGAPLGVLVDVDCGQHRCGVDPGEPVARLAQVIASAPGLQFKGICGYAGNIQGVEDAEKRTMMDLEAMEKVDASVDAVRKAGLDVEIVSAGGTGTYQLTGNHPGVTEVQPGSYVLMDAQYRRVLTDFEVAGTVLASVISRPAPDRAVLDSGMKAISTDQWPPVAKSVEGIEFASASDEHLVATLTTGDSRQLRPGDKIEIIPGHNDTTVNLHSHLHALRKGRLETVWEVGARGRIR